MIIFSITLLFWVFWDICVEKLRYFRFLFTKKKFNFACSTWNSKVRPTERCWLHSSNSQFSNRSYIACHEKFARQAFWSYLSIELCIWWSIIYLWWKGNYNAIKFIFVDFTLKFRLMQANPIFYSQKIRTIKNPKNEISSNLNRLHIRKQASLEKFTRVLSGLKWLENWLFMVFEEMASWVNAELSLRLACFSLPQWLGV